MHYKTLYKLYENNDLRDMWIAEYDSYRDMRYAILNLHAQLEPNEHMTIEPLACGV